MKRRREALFPEIHPNHPGGLPTGQRVVCKCKPRKQLVRRIPVVKQSRPLRFHHPREFFLSMAGKTVSGVARNFIFSPIPAPFTDFARLERWVGISMTGFQVSSFT